MPFCCAAAASRSCRRLRWPGGSVKARVKSRDRSSVFIGLSFPCGGARVRAPEGGDAVSGCAPCGVGAATDDGGDAGVGQSGEVVIRDGLFLLGRQPGEDLSEIVADVQVVAARGLGYRVGWLGDG